jgi:hypothetical protein
VVSGVQDDQVVPLREPAGCQAPQHLVDDVELRGEAWPADVVRAASLVAGPVPLEFLGEPAGQKLDELLPWGRA